MDKAKQRLCGEDWHDLMTEEEYLENIMEMSKTCLLEKDHEGEHEWTDDDKWGVSFVGKTDTRERCDAS